MTRALKFVGTAKQLQTCLEPYKRVLGVVVRDTCVSLSVSNHINTLAEPLPGLMLRQGEIPEASLRRILAKSNLVGADGDVGALVLGAERMNDSKLQGTQERAIGVLSSVLPGGLPAMVHDKWEVAMPPSPRLDPGTCPTCGQAFLQHFLDSWGELNTFG
ncbi:unnamed protein product [Pedinophyceae sp. YPF-701]|nr:unnamed protein product [Pedinophyceae sp. YPF-701]